MGVKIPSLSQPADQNSVMKLEASQKGFIQISLEMCTPTAPRLDVRDNSSPAELSRVVDQISEDYRSFVFLSLLKLLPLAKLGQQLCR